jgi:hypothetical protein
MPTTRCSRLLTLLALAGASGTLSAQQTSYDLSVLLPSAEDVAPEAVLSEESPTSEWGGIAGFSRMFGHDTGLLTLGSSTTMFVQVAATLYETVAEARGVIMVLRNMDPASLAELFGLGVAEAMGGSVDSLAAKPLEPPDVGEDAGAFLFYMDIGFMAMEMHMVLFQRGRYGGAVAMAGPPGETYLGDLTPLAAAIDRRMQEVAVEDLPQLADAVAQAPRVRERSPALDDARGMGVDLETLLARPDGLAGDAEVTDEQSHAPLDGVASLYRGYEAPGTFAVGGSQLLGLDLALTLYDSPAAALLQVLSADIDLASCLDQGAAEAFGADAVTVATVEVPTLTVPAAAARAQIRTEFFNAEALGLVVVYGSLAGHLLLAGELDRVAMVDAVTVARGILGRIEDIVPARRTAPATAADSASVARVLDVERMLRRGDVDAALRRVRAIDGAAASLASTWVTVCRWGALWNRADAVLEHCDRAVASSDGHPVARDSRGIARALAGDTDGAIEDLDAFAEWTLDEDNQLERLDWIEQLENGEQPFTDEVLTTLRGACWRR